MTQTPVGYVSDPSLRLLALPLGALGATTYTPLDGASGLPEGVIRIATPRLILAATPCAGPLFIDALSRAGQRFASDIVLVRTGFAPEILDLVTVDVVLATSVGAIVRLGLIFYRHEDGALWLVPDRDGPVVGINRCGLRLDPRPPFVDRQQRADGVCRAATEIVRLTRAARD